jgi:hypothetical protein
MSRALRCVRQKLAGLSISLGTKLIRTVHVSLCFISETPYLGGNVRKLGIFNSSIWPLCSSEVRASRDPPLCANSNKTSCVYLAHPSEAGV